VEEEEKPFFSKGGHLQRPPEKTPPNKVP